MKLGFWAYIILIASTSILFLVIGLHVFKDFNSSLGFVSLYIAFTSIAMAINSHFLSEDTDARINDIANTHFLTIISSFEDRRLDIEKQIGEHNQIVSIMKYNEELEQEPKKKIIRFTDNHQLYLWKAVVDLQKAEEITKGKCKIKPEHFKPLMNRFLSLMQTIIKIKPLLLCESVNNMISIYKITFKIVPEDTLSEINNISKMGNKETAELCFRQILDLDDAIPVNDRLFSIIKKTTGQENNKWNKFSNYKKQVLKDIKKEKWN